MLKVWWLLLWLWLWLSLLLFWKVPYECVYPQNSMRVLLLMVCCWFVGWLVGLFVCLVGLVWFGLVSSGLVWSGSVWFGLVRSDLVWSGLVWFGWLLLVTCSTVCMSPAVNSKQESLRLIELITCVMSSPLTLLTQSEESKT